MVALRLLLLVSAATLAVGHDGLRRQLRKNKARLDKAREKAPSLVARLSLESARDKARAQALRKVAKAVYGTDKADWARVPDAEAIFDAEDRAFLEIGAEADDDFEFE